MYSHEFHGGLFHLYSHILEDISLLLYIRVALELGISIGIDRMYDFGS